MGRMEKGDVWVTHSQRLRSSDEDLYNGELRN